MVDDRTAELRRVFGVRNVSVESLPLVGDYVRCVRHTDEQARLRVLRIVECCQSHPDCSSLLVLGDDDEMCRQVCGASVELIDNT